MLSKIIKCRSGNFGIIAAIALLPIMLSCGVAVDVTNLIRIKTNLQNANDAAAFMATRALDETGALPPKSRIKRQIEDNFGRQLVDLDIRMDGSNLVLTSRYRANLIFGGLLPDKTSDVGVLSAVNVQGKRQLEVVLVLDSTGSMKYDGKMVGLKKAAKDFIDTLLDLNKNGESKVKIGIVPFAQYVNVGMENRYAKWMSVPADSSKGYTSCSNKYKSYKTTCTPVTRYDDGVPYQDTSCSSAGQGEPTKVCTAYTSKHAWHGCVGSRLTAPALKDTDPGKPFPGLIDTWCSSPIQALTANRGTLTSKISSLNPSGQTYIADGVMWGLRVISDAEPFTEAAVDSSSGKTERVMVLMTDGDNVRASDLPSASTHNESKDMDKADEETRLACAEVKNAEASLYTISFGTAVSARGKALMSNCADPGRFYDATDVSKISAAFEKIATSLASIRLTQ